MDFGQNFVEARNRRGIEQKDAAEKLGLSAAYLSRVETGKQKPSLDLILKAAKFYNVEPGFFFSGRHEININSLYTEKNKAFISDLQSLTDQEIRDKYRLELDGKELSDTELKGVMAYIRSLRAME